MLYLVCNSVGSGRCLFFRSVKQEVLDGMLGFAAGVMIAASFWSLLAPAIDMAEATAALPAWVPALVGFLLGGLFLRLADFLLPHLHLSFPDDAEGLTTTWRREGLSRLKSFW